jgi:3-methyladenine DNA glycosylase AlkD
MSMNPLGEILSELKRHGSGEAVKGMARFGVGGKHALGVSMPVIRSIGRKVGRDHSLALKLWKSGIHEARILASLVDEPVRVTPAQMDRWVRDFDSWDVCDQVCMNLFGATPFAHRKAVRWTRDEREFVKRAGYALMACLAVHDKKALAGKFEVFFPAIYRGAMDERNFVKKAVNWALRQIGKREPLLNKKAIRLAEEIQKLDSRSARWIASDALRELTSTSVQRRLKG